MNGREVDDNPLAGRQTGCNRCLVVHFGALPSEMSLVQSTLPYRIFRRSGRDVLAMPLGGRKLRTAAIRCIPVTGRVGRWSRLGLESASRLGLDAFLGASSKEPVRTGGQPGWSSLFRSIQAALAREDIEVAVTHPPQGSRQRLYVHVLSREGTRLAFAKVSSDEENDAGLRWEADVLRRVWLQAPANFRVPGVIDSREVGGRAVLLLEPVPVRATPVT
jgi:hypothetical protein